MDILALFRRRPCSSYRIYFYQVQSCWPHCFYCLRRPSCFRLQIEEIMPGAMQWVYSLLFGFFSFILFETATRGTILGITFAVVFIFIYYALFARGVTTKRVLSLVGSGVVALVIGLYYFFHQDASYLIIVGEAALLIFDIILGIYVYYDNKHITDKSVAVGRWVSVGMITLLIGGGILFYTERNSSFIQHNDVLQRIASISLQDTQSQARAYIWPMAIKGAFQSPKTALIGWGQENFNYIFNADYNPLMWHQEQWFDRAHSVPLDWLVAGGLIGVILYLSLFVFALVSIVKSDISISQKAILTALLAGYGIHIIFVFDNLASYVLFATVLAFATSLHQRNAYAWLDKKIDLLSENFCIVRDYAVTPVLLILLAITIYFVNVTPIEANTRLVTALQACSSLQTASPDLFVSALSLNKYMANQEIREQLISCSESIFENGASTDLKSAFYALTAQEINNQIQATPNDARIYLLGGGFYDAVGDFTSALPLLEKAHELSPGKQTIDFELAGDYMNIGSTTEALALMQQAYQSAPDDGDSQVGYISTLILAGQEQKAYDLFGSNPDVFVDQRIINVYAKLKNYPKVVELYKQLILKDPTNAQTYLSLAAGYLYENDLYDAEQELKLIEDKFPESKTQLDPVLKQVEAGKNPISAEQSQ